ncbi:MAG TPA: hypothetical protein VH299_14680 [Solirubrobacterales bacterium]|nr:hypothetical protein [Solirubrobacterales bacterium]
MKLFSKGMLVLAAVCLILGIWSLLDGEFRSGVSGLSVAGFLLFAARWETKGRDDRNAKMWIVLGAFFLAVGCADLITAGWLTGAAALSLGAVLLKNVLDDRRKPTDAHRPKISI